jgi:hypothetical protein
MLTGRLQMNVWNSVPRYQIRRPDVKLPPQGLLSQILRKIIVDTQHMVCDSLILPQRKLSLPFITIR